MGQGQPVRPSRRSLGNEQTQEDPDISDGEGAKTWGTKWVAFILAAAWVLLGLIAYKSQRWGKKREPYTLAETVYVMAQILTTVGYGDYVPVKDSGFYFTAFYVLMATMAISTCGAALVEASLMKKLKIIKDTLKENRFTQDTSILLDGAFQSMPIASDNHPARQFIVSYAKDFQEYVKGNSGVVNFAIAFGKWSFFVLVGWIFYCNYPGEGKDPAEGLYMSVMTLTTVGFGDITPITVGGQLFATVWMVAGTVAFANMVASFSAAFLARSSIRRLSHSELQSILKDELFKKCHHNETQPQISRADFILFMLKDIGALDLNMVEQLSSNFDELDEGGAGYLKSDRLSTYMRVRSFDNQQPRVGRYHTVL